MTYSNYLFEPNNSSVEVKDTIKSIVGYSSNIEIVAPDTLISVSGYDLTDFLDDFKDLFTKYQKLTNELKNFSVKPAFVAEHVTEDEQNAIRFRVLKRTNGTLSQGANPGQGVLNHKWLQIAVLEDKLNPGYKAVVYGKWMDNIIEILSCSKNYRDADKGANTVENLIELHSGLFRMKGLTNLRYIGRESDRYREVANIGQYEMPLVYHCRTLKTQIVYEKILEELTIEKIIK